MAVGPTLREVKLCGAGTLARDRAQECARHTLVQYTGKGKGQSCFHDWPLFMPATTYAPTHFRVQYHRPCGA